MRRIELPFIAANDALVEMSECVMRATRGDEPENEDARCSF